MKKIILILIIFLCHLPAPAQQTQNYVLSSAVNNSGAMQSVYHYYDASGRPFERVEVGITPSHSNLAWLSDYDGIGRPSRDWLPATVSADYVQPSALRSTGYSAYSDSRPFSETLYDGSPLNRETAAIGTGQQWTAHYRSTDYLINTDTFPLSCRNYHVNASGSLSDFGLFPASRLSIIRQTDEDGRVTLEFRDHQERTVLVRRMLTGNSSADTYYVYDRRGDLRYVLQPEYQQSPDLDKFAFRYAYDTRHNVVEKQLPGAGAVTYGYDMKNQLIFSQDGVQRQAGRITFMLYDLHGRLLVRGTCDEESWTEEYPQDELYSTPALASFSATASGLGGSGYETNLTLLDASVEEAHYYDGYDFLSCNGFSVQAFPAGTVNAKGLETGSVVNTLDGTATRLYTVNYYDEKGRQTKRISTNLLGGTETTESTYGYTDKPLTVSHTHTAEGKATQVEIYSYEYDHADRLTKVSHSLNGGAAVVLKENTYDNYGRLVSQNLMGSETVGHSYNIRNWPTSISSSHFTELMEYASGQHPFFNGNVSRMLWRTSGESSFRVYDFQYDGLNRLTSAAYGGQGNFSTGYGYDLNGNLTCLARIGRLSGDTYGPTDSLTFFYNGNQVTRIEDAAIDATGSGRYDFRNGANQEGEYAYDANGNMTRDLNKKLSSIQYNSRNLPERINFTDGKYITYVYDATGQKLRVNYHPSQTATTGFQMDYCGNLQYENGLLKRILIDGGYVSFSGTTPYYHYYLQDHLGSNRVVMNKTTGATIQVNHYYPYGGLFANSTNVAGLYYKFNGKEIDHRYNLELSDYGARFYDAFRASWLTMDPLCEKYYGLSPYAMCGDNPINYIDINGLDWVRREHDGVVEYYYDRDVESEKDVEDKDGVTYVGHGMTIRMGDETYSFYNDKEINKYGYVVNQNDMLLDNTKITSGNGYRIFGTSNHSVNAKTLYQNLFGTSYTGKVNPKDYNGKDSYQFLPQSGSEWGSYIHDLLYDEAHAKGEKSAFFNTDIRVLLADDFLVGYNLYNMSNNGGSFNDKLRSAATVVGFGVILIFKLSLISIPIYNPVIQPIILNVKQ